MGTVGGPGSGSGSEKPSQVADLISAITAPIAAAVSQGMQQGMQNVTFAPVIHVDASSGKAEQKNESPTNLPFATPKGR